MNSFAAVVFCLAVASASASHVGLGYGVYGHHEAHIPSGSVAVGHDGAVIAGPSGSVKTNNGLHGVAGAQISGPAGDVATHGGHARLAGPGYEHDHYGHGLVAAPIVAPVAPVAHHAVVAAPAWGHYGAGYSHGAVVAGPTSHTTIVGPSSHATVVAPVAHAAVVAAPAWGHHGAVVAAPAWGHYGGAYSHGIVAHGHHGW